MFVVLREAFFCDPVPTKSTCSLPEPGPPVPQFYRRKISALVAIHRRENLAKKCSQRGPRTRRDKMNAKKASRCSESDVLNMLASDHFQVGLVSSLGTGAGRSRPGIVDIALPPCGILHTGRHRADPI